MPRREKVLEKQILKQDARMKQVLLKARDRMELKILKAAKQGNFVRSALIRDTLYTSLRDEYLALQGDLNAWGIKATTDVARQWRKFAIDDLPATAVDQSFGAFEKKYLSNMVGKFGFDQPPIAGLNAQLGGMYRNDIRILRGATADVFRLGSATGMTTDGMRREILQRITSVKPGFQFVDKAGKVWNTNTYLGGLVQSVVSETARESYKSVAAEAGYDLATIEGGVTGSSTKYPKDPCDAWAGRIISITGATEGYPTEEDAKEAGVFHVNCRHYLAVVLDDVPGAVERAEEEEGELREEEDQLEEKVA